MTTCRTTESKYIARTKALSLVCGFAMLMLCGVSHDAHAVVPDTQQALLQLTGTGVPPMSKVDLIAGKSQAISVQADKKGQFAFSGLQYFSFTPLNLTLSLPEQSTETVAVRRSQLHINFDPNGSTIKIFGNIAPAGSIAVNVDGIRGNSQIANDKGEFTIQTQTPLGLADGTSQIFANIANLGEACCPKMMVPVSPVQLMISSVPVREPVPLAPAPKAGENPAAKKPATYMMTPKQDKENKAVDTPQPAAPEKEQKKKSSAPYMVLGETEQSLDVEIISHQTSAISFPSSTYDSTWVGGFKKSADMLRNAIASRALMIGAFLDGRSANASIGVVRSLNAETMKDYHVSDAVCKFGTLSKAIASSQDLADANKLVFSKTFLDRNAQAKNLLYTESNRAMVDVMNDFKAKYCEKVGANGALEGYCNSIAATPDLYYDRDIDFTRVFDTPLTLDVNYTDNTITDQEQTVLALFHNLSLVPPENGTEDGESIVKQEKSDDMQDLHQMQAVRELVANTFANQVAMKAKGTNKSATYMQNVLTKLGLSSADAKKLITDNPSYYAQMEILTKKIYQDPSFYVNLYDTPANVDRQKVSMLAIQLMQERDLLETMRRKEMLLSELLEMKIRKASKPIEQSAVNSDL